MAQIPIRRTHYGMVETLLSMAAGIGLAAACGFRVFLPFLGMSVAARSGHLVLPAGSEWIGTSPALIVFLTATVLEVLAYYIPWLDHALDVAASPVAVAAGTLAAASVVVGLPPLLKWSLALIAGGGAAGVVQAATVGVRLKSALFTGGAANPIVATGELMGALGTVLLAILAPIVCLIAVGAFLVSVVRRRPRAPT